MELLEEDDDEDDEEEDVEDVEEFGATVFTPTSMPLCTSSSPVNKLMRSSNTSSVGAAAQIFLNGTELTEDT